MSKHVLDIYEWIQSDLFSRIRSTVKIKISEKSFCEKENSPLLKPQEKDFMKG